MLYCRLFRLPLIFAISVSGAAAYADAVFEPRSATMTPNESADEEQQGGGAAPAPDSELAQRLAQAQTVISGVVLNTAKFGDPKPPFLSQHDPDWWQATIQVETVEKGTVATKTTPVLYANSTDIGWYQSPKLAKGDHGVWLLQGKDPFGQPVPAPAVVHALDSHPIANLAKVRTLLKSAPKK